MPNGNLLNGIAKPVNIITPQSNNHAGLLKQIETGKLKFTHCKTFANNYISFQAFHFARLSRKQTELPAVETIKAI